jgi:hypothetical protein
MTKRAQHHLSLMADNRNVCYRQQLPRCQTNNSAAVFRLRMHELSRIPLLGLDLRKIVPLCVRFHNGNRRDLADPLNFRCLRELAQVAHSAQVADPALLDLESFLVRAERLRRLLLEDLPKCRICKPKCQQFVMSLATVAARRGLASLKMRKYCPRRLPSRRRRTTKK